MVPTSWTGTLNRKFDLKTSQETKLIGMFSRFAKLCYAPDGKQVMEQLWQETMQELAFANAKEILMSMRKA